MDDGWLLTQMAEIEAIKAEIQGMIALNQYRLSREGTIAYDEKSFCDKAFELREISIRIMKYR